MATTKEFSAVMALLASTYPNFPMTAATMKVYQEFLADIPPEALMDVAKKHINESKWFPTIAELRQPYVEYGKRQKRRLEDREWKRRLEGWKAESRQLTEGAELPAPDAYSDTPLSWAVLKGGAGD